MKSRRSIVKMRRADSPDHRHAGVLGTRFAHTGDPSGEGALEWPLYDDATDQRINFRAENTILSGFRRQQCELWWSFYAEDFE